MEDTRSVDDLCAEVLKRLQSCRTTEDFVQVYDSPDFQKLMDTLRQALTASGTDVDTWAKNWAIRMRTALAGPDIDLNQCRRTVLKLLYELCNAWRDKSNTNVTEASMVGHFQRHRVESILLLALPLDRAQCLYAMKYPSTNQYGMHWISSVHVDNNPLWQERLREVAGLPTMNKRLLWLKDLDGLQLASPEIARWLEPTECETYIL